MNILGIETSTSQSSIAVATEKGVFTREGSSGRHSTTLFSDCEELLAEAGITVHDIEAVAAGLGPGSYTGIRIAVTAVKSLAWSLGIPAGGVSSFQAIAAAAAGSVRERPVLQVVGDARMKEVFLGTYDLTDGVVTERFLKVLPVEELEDAIESGSCITGPSVDLCAGIKKDCLVLEGFAVPAAACVISETARAGRFSDVLETDLEPLYLKKSEPERKGLVKN